MDANLRSELAITILKFEKENDLERFVLLRDTEGVVAGNFRDIDIFAESFNLEKFTSYLKSKSFLVVKIVRRYHFYQFSVFYLQFYIQMVGHPSCNNPL